MSDEWIEVKGDVNAIRKHTSIGDPLEVKLISGEVESGWGSGGIVRVQHTSNPYNPQYKVIGYLGSYKNKEDKDIAMLELYAVWDRINNRPCSNAALIRVSDIEAIRRIRPV